MPKKFTVSILTYKAFPLVKACIDSVLKHSPIEDLRVILTDNGNKNGAGAYFDQLAAQYPDIFIVAHNAENIGFIEPNKRALALTEGEYFVMLNDDATVPAGWLQALEEPFKIYPKAALSGLKGGCQSLNADFHGRQGGAFEYLEGSCLMCKTEIVKKHGLFADYLEFAYGEDSDLSLRMRQLGYTLHQVPLHLHHVRAQTSRHIPNINAIQAKNHSVLKKVWNHYIRVRKFDYPITVRRWAARGDVLLVTAILKKLSETYPLSPISVETAFPELFKGNPYVAKAATSIPRNFETRIINLDMAYENRNKMSIVDAYCAAAGVKLDSAPITEIHWDEEDDKWVGQFLGVGKGGWCAIHAGPTTWVGKNWPQDKWVSLAKELKEQFGYKIVLIGHGESSPIPCDRDARGVTTANRAAALLSECKLFIGLDSFPLHLAQAAGTPVIGLFGVTLPDMILTDGSAKVGVTGSPSAPDFGIRHRIPGQTMVKSDGYAMASISVEKVLDAVQEISWATGKRRKLEAVS